MSFRQVQTGESQKLGGEQKRAGAKGCLLCVSTDNEALNQAKQTHRDRISVCLGLGLGLGPGWARPGWAGGGVHRAQRKF